MESSGRLSFPVAAVFDAAIAPSGIGTPGSLADESKAYLIQELRVQGDESLFGGVEHLDHGGLDQRQGGQVTELDGGQRSSFGGLGHHPACEIAEEQMGIDLFENTVGSMGT